MNDSILSGKWREIKGEVKKAWGELTDDEVNKTEGNAQSLIGLLQQKFGYAKEEATEKLHAFVAQFEARHADTVKKVSDSANEKIDSAKASAKPVDKNTIQ